MYITESSPNSDHRGTPPVMVDIFELKPLIETHFFRSVLSMIQTIYDKIFLLLHNDLVNML